MQPPRTRGDSGIDINYGGGLFVVVKSVRCVDSLTLGQLASIERLALLLVTWMFYCTIITILTAGMLGGGGLSGLLQNPGFMNMVRECTIENCIIWQCTQVKTSSSYKFDVNSLCNVPSIPTGYDYDAEYGFSEYVSSNLLSFSTKRFFFSAFV